jgi:hypothetical protein
MNERIPKPGEYWRFKNNPLIIIRVLQLYKRNIGVRYYFIKTSCIFNLTTDEFLTYFEPEPS